MFNFASTWSCNTQVELNSCDDRGYLFVADMRQILRSPVCSGRE